MTETRKQRTGQSGDKFGKDSLMESVAALEKGQAALEEGQANLAAFLADLSLTVYEALGKKESTTFKESDDRSEDGRSTDS